MILSSRQLEEIKKQLDRYFFTAGVNVALLNALEGNESITFRNKVIKALMLQIFHVAQLEKIFLIIQTVKKQDDELFDQIQKEWLSFDQAIIGGNKTLFLFLLFAAVQGGQSGLDKIFPQFTFKLTNQSLRNQIQERVNFLIETIDRTSIEWISKIIKNSLADNASAMDIVKILRQEATRTARIRGDLITENELATTMNLMELEVFQKNGIQKVLWKTSQDERVEEVCLVNEAAGAIILGKEFPMGQTRPPAHQRCRCYLLPVLPQAVEGEIWTGN